MGDMADMMLDGTLCADCGTVFSDMLPTRGEEKRARRENRLPVSDATPPGYPRYCEECRRDARRPAVADQLTTRQRFDAAADLRRVACLNSPTRWLLENWHAASEYGQHTFDVVGILDIQIRPDERRLLMLLLAEAIEQGDLP